MYHYNDRYPIGHLLLLCYYLLIIYIQSFQAQSVDFSSNNLLLHTIPRATKYEHMYRYNLNSKSFMYNKIR